jgi:hypothetical protein
MYCHSEYGPTFGCGRDICIANNTNTTMDSWYRLSCTYSHPQYVYNSNEAQSFMAGSYQFKLEEIEVYERE